MRILYLRPANIQNPRHPGKDSPLFREIAKLGELTDIPQDPGMSEAELAELIRDYDVLLTMWKSQPVPVELAQNPGRLKYICNITGEMRKWIPQEIVDSPHITVTNWGDAPAFTVAEGAMSLLMACMKSLPMHWHSQTQGNLKAPEGLFPASLYKLPVGIYGMGVIGRAFVKMLEPFQPEILAYDPYVDEMPEGVEKVSSLEGLFSRSKAIVVHAGLSAETHHSVSRELLALLPDHAIVVNTARGGILDQEALLDEVVSGRLRAALDVLEGDDTLAADHPARQCPNLLLTSHAISNDLWSFDPQQLDRKGLNCIDNLKRFAEGKPLRFVMTPERYRIST